MLFVLPFLIVCVPCIVCQEKQGGSGYTMLHKKRKTWMSFADSRLFFACLRHKKISRLQSYGSTGENLRQLAASTRCTHIHVVFVQRPWKTAFSGCKSGPSHVGSLVALLQITPNPSSTAIASLLSSLNTLSLPILKKGRHANNKELRAQSRSNHANGVDPPSSSRFARYSSALPECAYGDLRSARGSCGKWQLKKWLKVKEVPTRRSFTCTGPNVKLAKAKAKAGERGREGVCGLCDRWAGSDLSRLGMGCQQLTPRGSTLPL